jgi:hypoxanthine phosphoribosyltransferase
MNAMTSSIETPSANIEYNSNKNEVIVTNANETTKIDAHTLAVSSSSTEPETVIAIATGGATVANAT